MDNKILYEMIHQANLQGKILVKEGDNYRLEDPPVIAKTNEDIARDRALAYAQISDPLVCELQRKRALNLFEPEEEQALLEAIADATDKVKAENPYIKDKVE